MAHVGRSVQITGELSGDEDLIIDGRVDGKIVLNGHRAVIGPHGRVTAEILAHAVIVNGEVAGNITANNKVEIAATGSVVGDVRAPRVVLADGARFRGRIEMDANAANQDPRTAPTARPAAAGGSFPGDLGVTVDIADT